jgi:hypothetical protein
MGAEFDEGSWTSPITNPATPNVVVNAAEGYPATGAITYSPTYEWEWAMVYEWSVDLAQFSNIPAFVVVGLSHHSPGKGGDEDDPFTPPPGGPEPLSDFADLPALYATTLAANGPRHSIDPNGVKLGAQMDTESDAVPSATALGDDTSVVNDEEGVEFLTPFVPGSRATIRVTTSGGAGFLSGFVDWTGGGTLAPVNVVSSSGPSAIPAGPLTERPLTVPGVYTLVVDVPANATGLHPTLWRVTNNAGQGGNAVTGLATSGEVESYVVSRVGNRVWRDEDEDGIQDPGEPGQDGVIVRLLNADGTPVLDGNGNPVTTVTSGGGFYGFTIPYGTDYRIQVDEPIGFNFTNPNADGQGINGPDNSDVATDTGTSGTFSTTQGQTNNNIRVGLIEEPLIVDLLSMTVSEAADGGLDIAWQTGAEYGSAGFDVYRMRQTTDRAVVSAWTRVNADMIPAMGSPVEGATYTLRDNTPFVDGEIWSYRLVETEFSGTQNTYGPVLFPANAVFGGSGLGDWSRY